MKKRTKTVLVVIAGVVSAIVLTFVGVVAYFIYTFPSFNEDPHQSDEIMLSRFHEHRAEFERLREMAVEDDLMRRVDDTWTDPANLPDARVAEYRRLFKLVETPRGISKYRDKNQLVFLASTLGWVASGSSKGYLYSPGKRPSGKFIESLNDYEKLRERDVYFLRQIEGDWYLFFERS